MRFQGRFLSFIVASTMSAVVYAGSVEHIPPTHNWLAIAGTSYAVVDGSSTRGDLAPTLLPLTFSPNGNAYVSDRNLVYNNVWTKNVALLRRFGPYFKLGFAYESLLSSISPGAGVTLVVPPNSSGATYRADITINRLSLKGRLGIDHAFTLYGMMNGVFVGASIGAANLNMTKQSDTVFNSGDFTFGISNHSIWQFSYSVELGLMTQVTKNCFIDYGVRYVNYGKFNSGTNLINYPNVNMKRAVSAQVYAIEPFFELSYQFA